MSRSRCTFRQQDATRLLKAANAAGYPVDRLEIFDPLGNKFVAIMGNGNHTARVDGAEEGDRNPWDEVLIDAQDKNGTS